MVQPNLPPQAPAAANLAPVHGPEAVPDPNQQMTQEQWVNDRLELRTIVTQLSETYRYENNLNKFLIDGRVDQSDEAARRQEIHTTRATILQQLDSLAIRSDTTAILDSLDGVADIAAGHRKRSTDRISDAQDAEGGARFKSDVADVKYFQTTNEQALNPIDASLSAADKKAEQKHRASEHSIYRHASVRENRAYQAATDEVSDSILSASKSEGFASAARGAADRLRNNHDNIRTNIENISDDVNDELNNWDIRPNHQTGTHDEQYIRNRLEDLKQAMAGLSPHDKLRALAQGEYVRLRYRLESRGINEDGAVGQQNTDRRQTNDGGILLYEGTADEIAIYDNGSTARYDASAGELVHRRPSGEVFDPATAHDRVEIVIGAAAPNEPLSTVFNRWEEYRTPETAAAAHASLSEYVGNQSARETRFTELITDYGNQINTANTQIQEAQQQQQAAAATISRLNALGNLSQEEQDELQQAQADEAGAVAAERVAERNLQQAQTDRSQAEGGLARTRENLNPARYWQARLEVGAQVHHPAAQQSRFILNRLVRKQADTPPAPPQLMRDGSVLLDNATINGVQDPRWRVWPDGTTGRWVGNAQAGRTQFYNPQGQPI